MPSTRSRVGELLDGVAPPRLHLAPDARANSWEDVADLSATLGMPLDEWQEIVLAAAMGERADGRWAAKYVGVSAARQNGKSTIIVARALAGVLLFGEKMIIISAHETDTAREVWRRLIDVVEANPMLENRVTGRMNAINREYIIFGHGAGKQVVKLKARRASGARGFSADCLLLDEAQILDRHTWGSINPIVSAQPNPQIWLFGTPPTEADAPFAFSRVRESAIARKPRHAWLEWSAERGDDLDDPATWAKANPSYGVRISPEACEDDRVAMDDAQFALERLGMWTAVDVVGVLPAPTWATQADTNSLAADFLALGVEVGPDLAWASVALAGRRVTDGWHVELDDDQHTRGRGVEWVIPHVTSLVAKNPQIRAVVCDVAGPMAALLDKRGGRWFLKGTTLRVLPLTVRQLGVGCAQLLSGVVAGWLWHIGQPQLTAAALSASKRVLGDTGMWVWSRRSADSDITPIQAATYALIGAQEEKPVRPGGQQIATGDRLSRTGEGRRAVVL